MSLKVRRRNRRRTTTEGCASVPDGGQEAITLFPLEEVRQKAALRYVDVLISSPSRIDADVTEGVRTSPTPSQPN